jgi:hypothetical protein
MTVNYEVKSQLAKLLATEDIVVENREVMTAQFDVENRVLTLPMWKRASNVVYDMLVGHEVGHALYTPNVDPPGDIPHSFVNIIEDARIEKLMKRRYPGLAKSFFKGYNELSDQDFFCIDDQDIERMNLADRINLYWKIGNFIDIPFQATEIVFRDRVGLTETFGEVCNLAREIYSYCKDQQSQTKTDTHNPEPKGTNNQQGDNVENSETPESSSDDMTHEEMIEEAAKRESENQESDTGNEVKQESGEPEATTDRTFEDGISELNGMDRGIQNIYVEVPDVNLDNIIIDHVEVQRLIDEDFARQLVPMEHKCEFTGEVKYQVSDFTRPDVEYQKFKRESQREVNYLVKEFECKKSADAYSRSFVSKTGVLDCTKLHTYKYNENLFRKINVLPDGQNHGLIFVLDWSGSMGDYILDTVKQLINLVWFCNKCNIPFEVYAFTNSFYWRSDDVEMDSMEWENSKLFVHKDFNLINFLSSRTKRNNMEKQILNLWRIAYYFKTWGKYEIPQGFGLSGTPLNESLVSLYKIIPQFKKNNDLQKVQCVILTDGEANYLPYCNYWDSEKYGIREGHSNLSRGHSYLRNRSTGHTYKIGDYYYQFTETLLADMKETFPGTNFIGIRIAATRDVNSMIKRYEEYDIDKKVKQVKKDKFFSINNSGYSSYFIMVDQALNNDVDFQVEEGASKAKIRTAFVKNLKAKSLNKKVLSQFMDLVC